MYLYSFPGVAILVASLFVMYIAARVDLSHHPVRHVFHLHRVAGVIGCILSVWDMWALLSIDIAALPVDAHGAKLVPSSVYTPYAMFGAVTWFLLNAASSIPLLLRVHQQFHHVLRQLFVGCLANLIMPLLVFVYVVVVATISTRRDPVVWMALAAATLVIMGALGIMIALTIANSYHALAPAPVRKPIPTAAPTTTPESTPPASPRGTTRKLTVHAGAGQQTSLAAAMASAPSIHHSKEFSIPHFTSSMIRWMSSNGLSPWREYEADVTIARYATIIGTITIMCWVIFVMLTATTYLNTTNVLAAATAPVWTTSHISLSALLFTQVLHASIFSNNISVFSFTMLFRGLAKRRVGLLLYNLFSFPAPFVLTAYLVASFGQSTSWLDFVLQQFAYQPLSQCGII